MAEYRGLDILDYLVIITKWKKKLLVLAIFTMVIAYITIYFFVDEQFESTALVITSENSSSSGLNSLMKSFSNLPISISGINSNSVDTDLFTTIIYSRTNLKKIVDKFELFKEFKEKTMQATLKDLASIIKADETKEGAYEIKIRNKSPQKAANMVNFIVDQLNNTLIELNVAKSKDNRLFMEKRYNEIKDNLKLAEDSLVLYQKQSGILYAEDQIKSSYEAYTKLEAELAAKEVEYTVMSNLYGDSSPLVQPVKIAVKKYSDKLNKIKNGNDGSNLILALKNLPQKSMAYLRHYRDVEIYNAMLQFIIPLYEQSRFEEQKNIPLLQVIDYGIPAEKKAYPPRVLLSILFTLIVLLCAVSTLIIKEIIVRSENPKVIFLRQNIFRMKYI